MTMVSVGSFFRSLDIDLWNESDMLMTTNIGPDVERLCTTTWTNMELLASGSVNPIRTVLPDTLTKLV